MNYLEHHGIKGQKWGVRRFQQLNGTYTEEGKRRRRSNDNKEKASNRNVKNYLKAKLGIYKSYDDNPYVSEKRRQKRAREEQLPAELKRVSNKAALKIAEKNAETASKAAELAKKRYEELQKRQSSAGSLRKSKNYRNEDGSLTDEGKRRKSKGREYSEDYWNAHDKKDPKYMTDKELQKRLQRLNNESQYKNLTKTEAQKKGEKFAEDVVKAAVSATVIYAVNRLGHRFVDQYLKRH